MRAKNYIAMTTLAAAVTSGGALANQGAAQDDMKKWAEVREKTFPADEILSGTVMNLFNPIGKVDMLILSEDHSEVEYILFDVPFPYSFYTAEDGFVNFDNVEIEDGYYGLNVTIEDANVSLPRDQLKLTRGETNDRRVDLLIGSKAKLEDDQTREIQDILINPKNGKVTHYVVEMNPEALFAEDRRAIPAKYVSVHEDGKVTIDLNLKEAGKQLDVDPSYL